MSLSKEIVIGYTKGLLIDRNKYSQDLKNRIENGNIQIIRETLEYRFNELSNTSKNNEAASVQEVIDQLNSIF